MTQFKEKLRKLRKEATIGLFDYPVLMASDILLYRADFVAVGEDQKQHLEFARNIAKRFNSIYGEVLKIPDPLIPEKGARVMGLDNPMKKMSKSEESRAHAIHLLDSPDEIRVKIMKAKTDSRRKIRFNKDQPGIFNLLAIYEGLTNSSREEIERRFGDVGYADFKEELSKVIIDVLMPIQLRYQEIMEKPRYMEDLLIEGAYRVRPIADQLLSLVKDSVGLG
jgi:tryptophanyl-tRNA synthetase